MSDSNALGSLGSSQGSAGDSRAFPGSSLSSTYLILVRAVSPPGGVLGSLSVFPVLSVQITEPMPTEKKKEIPFV